MAKRRAKPRRRSRIRRFIGRHTKDKRIPLLPTIGFAAPLLTARPAWGNWSSPVEALAQGNIATAAQSAIANMTGLMVPMPGTGYTEGEIKFDMAGTLNPFDFRFAPAIKGLILGTVASKIMTKIGVNRYMKKVPFAGKYIKL